MENELLENSNFIMYTTDDGQIEIFIIGLAIFFTIEYITNEIKVKKYNKIGKNK